MVEEEGYVLVGPEPKRWLRRLQVRVGQRWARIRRGAGDWQSHRRVAVAVRLPTAPP